MIGRTLSHYTILEKLGSGGMGDVYVAEDKDLWMALVENGQERRLTDLAGKRGRPSGWAPDTDGEYVYFTWRDDVGDIWVMDVVEQ